MELVNGALHLAGGEMMSLDIILVVGCGLGP